MQTNREGNHQPLTDTLNIRKKFLGRENGRGMIDTKKGFWTYCVQTMCRGKGQATVIYPF